MTDHPFSACLCKSCSDRFIYMGELPPRHRRALRRFVAKFAKGAKEHGDLQLGKNWTTDMLEETVDDAFYRIFQLLEIEDAKAEEAQEEEG